MLKKVLGNVAVAGLLALGTFHSYANPTGGSVAAGCASINTCPGTVTVYQQSNVAVINWQSFSINAGEVTSFVQPCFNSAVLNRVCGGQTSVINGTLCANGQVYLVNGNGIVVGPTGMVNAASFTASTRDISTHDFMHGRLRFHGDNDAGVQNLGTINALGGNVFLLGKTVDNEGTINARRGTVGLAAGNSFFLSQNCEGGTVTVIPTCASGTDEAGKTAVKNGGTINAASAQLKAVNGNLYALAINNTGTIRATSVRHQGGHIFLFADSGTVANSGALDASAMRSGGTGGSVVIKSVRGAAIDTGTIIAQGGDGGTGGTAEVSGRVIQYHGTTDLTAPNGTTGTITFDPANIIIQGVDTGGTSTTSILTVADLENTLLTANIVVDAGSLNNHVGDLTLSAPLSWTSSNSLTLSAGNTIFLNGNITALNGGLALEAGNTITSGAEGAVNPNGVAADVNVASFTMLGGSWIQSSPLLPAFVDTGAFDLLNDSTFIRSAGGAGTEPDPFHLVDTFGVAGIPTFPDGTFYVLGFPTDISASEIDVAGALAAFDAYTANPPENNDFTPGASGNNLVSVNDPNSDGGAVNDDDGKEHHGNNIASGSSTAGMPAPSRLLTAGSGINTICNGSVSLIAAPPFVQKQLDSILNSSDLQSLDQASGTH
jgi:filamentous hemagglutinin family protein